MKKLFLYALLTFSFAISAQEKDKNLPKGNEDFKEKKYIDAEAAYRISASQNPTKAISSYNLGNTIYRQKQPSEAKLAYVKSIENAKTKPEKHRAYHNLGNIFMTEKKYSDAVEAYKNALRNNPSDEQTRYNYALAKEYLKNNPESPKDDSKKDKEKKEDKKKEEDKKDENKDKKDDKGDKDKDKGDDKKDNQDGKNDKDKKDGDNGDKPKPQPGNSPSKQNMQNLLDAVNNEEKKVQEKVNAKKVKGKPVQTEKDW